MSKRGLENIIYYHAHCYDGFTSAYIAWLALGDDATVYVPMKYDKPFPDEQILSMAKNIYFVDYSRPWSDIEKILSDPNKCVFILDHHKTAIEALQPYNHPRLFKSFDLDKSGAGLCWDYFFPKKEMPEFIKQVQRRDLWRKDDNTDLIHAALCSLPFDFNVWMLHVGKFDHENKSMIDSRYNDLLARGENILQYHQVLIEQFCEGARLALFDNQIIPIANISMLFSEVPHRLLEYFPDSPFAAYWFATDADNIQIGLRGRGDFDVSAVAKKFGGGGHYNASGFQLKLSEFQEYFGFEQGDSAQWLTSQE